MTLCYDPKAQKYVGSLVCSVDNHFWKYEGTLDAAGKVLTLKHRRARTCPPRAS